MFIERFSKKHSVGIFSEMFSEKALTWDPSAKYLASLASKTISFFFIITLAPNSLGERVVIFSPATPVDAVIAFAAEPDDVLAIPSGLLMNERTPDHHGVCTLAALGMTNNHGMKSRGG